jgi:uncharacterized Zn-binding protein involved in type VI secretion
MEHVMRAVSFLMIGAGAIGLCVQPARAQQAPDLPGAAAPGVITEGSGNTSIGGQAAARKGARTDGGSRIVEGTPNVYITGRPAAFLGEKPGCGGITVGGAGNVYINGKPAARAGDLTTGCANK